MNATDTITIEQTKTAIDANDAAEAVEAQCRDCHRAIKSIDTNNSFGLCHRCSGRSFVMSDSL